MISAIVLLLKSSVTCDSILRSELLELSFDSDTEFDFFEPIVSDKVPSSFCAQHAVDTECFDFLCDFLLFTFDGIFIRSDFV